MTELFDDVQFVPRSPRREALARIREGCDCDYCGVAPAEGYVSAYDVVVCEACYDDHHSRGG